MHPFLIPRGAGVIYATTSLCVPRSAVQCFRSLRHTSGHGPHSPAPHPRLLCAHPYGQACAPNTNSPVRDPQGEVAYGHISILRDSFHFLKISPWVSTSSYSPPPNSFSGAFAGSVSCDTFPLVRVTPPDLLRRGGGREGATARPRGLGVRLRCGRPRGGGGASFEVRGSLEAGPSHVCLPPVTRLLSIPRETAEQALQRDRSHETTEKKRAATGERERRAVTHLEERLMERVGHKEVVAAFGDDTCGEARRRPVRREPARVRQLGRNPGPSPHDSPQIKPREN